MTSQLEAVDYQWITRGFIRTIGAGGLLLGVAMVWGGPVRFSGPGFAAAREVPGGVYTWGVAVAACGAITVLGVLNRWRRRVVVLGLYLQALWFLFFLIGLAITTVQTPAGSVTGPIIYGLLGLLCMIAAVGGRGPEK